MAIRVSEAEEHPADRRAVHAVVRIAVAVERRGQRVDRVLPGNPDGEVVEPGGGLRPRRVAAQREVRAAVGMAHRDAHPHPLLDEVDHHLVAEAVLVPGL